MSQHGCPERLSSRSKGFAEEGSSQPTMELLVETLTGTAFEMTVSPSDTIFAIKSKIFRVEGIPVAQQHLVYNLQELEDARSLRELSIAPGARLRLVLGMRGGPVATRRLPPPAPPAAEPWPDIERLLDSNRDEVEVGGGGCKVTVLVFRDGERVNMLRVRENTDGTYSPIDTGKYSPSVPQLSEATSAEPAAGALRENAVTMGKMLELRRRMESLSVQRAACDSAAAGDKVEIQKTRSEEALPTHLRDAPPAEPYAAYDAHGRSPPDNTYTRYSYECGFGSRYTLLPPIGARDAPESDARHPALQRRQSRREGEEAAILEECLGEECVRPDPPALQPVAQDYGELVGGCAWRGHSASALQLRAGAPPSQLDAPFSSSTSELEKLKRNSRLLPGLSRARPREHLHLSDEGLHLRRDQPPALPDHRYLRRESSQPNGAEGRLYNRREMTSQPSVEERLYMRRETNSQPCGGEDRLYNRRDTSTEERLYNRREKLHKEEDRLYNRRESQNDGRLYRPHVTQTQDLYLRQDADDRLYIPAEDSDIFKDSQPIGIEDRLFMHTEHPDDSLYGNRDQILQSLNEDHSYTQRHLNEQSMSYEDRLYLRREMNSDDRLYNRGGKVGGKGLKVEKVVEAYRGCEEPPPVEATVEVKEKKIRLRCGWCKKRLSVATVHRCRCGGAWCAQHRYSEVHGCAWDYKAEARAPPSLLPPKLPKI